MDMDGKNSNRIGGFLICLYRNNFILFLVISWNISKRKLYKIESEILCEDTVSKCQDEYSDNQAEDEEYFQARK